MIGAVSNELAKGKQGQNNLTVSGTATPKSPLPVGTGPLSSTVLLETTQVSGTLVWSLVNGISFCRTALAGCTSVTDDTHTDG